MPNFMEKMRPYADKLLALLNDRTFESDPIAGTTASRITSVTSSMFKRHGHFLEEAFRQSLSDHGYIAWNEKRFQISKGKTCDVDALIFCPATRVLEAWEIKRGGDLDAPKTEITAARIRAVDLRLKEYGKTKGYLASGTKSWYLPYYVDEVKEVGRPLRHWLLLRDMLDEHFGFGMVAMVEEANAYFRTKFNALFPDTQ